jgi:plastocyanin
MMGNCDVNRAWGGSMRIKQMVWVGIVAGTVACGGSDSPTGNNGGNNGGNNTTCSSTSTDIDVSNNRFQPSCVTVPVGATITWTWSANAGNGHNVTFATGPNSATQTSGTFTRTFAAAGNFAYTCTVHGAAMSGSIRVQ